MPSKTAVVVLAMWLLGLVTGFIGGWQWRTLVERYFPRLRTPTHPSPGAME